VSCGLKLLQQIGKPAAQNSAGGSAAQYRPQPAAE
jgi:hypothetical protein